MMLVHLTPAEEATLRALRDLNDGRSENKRYGGARLGEIAAQLGKRRRRDPWPAVSSLIARGLCERLHGFDGVGDLVITEDGRNLLSEIESSRRFRE